MSTRVHSNIALPPIRQLPYMFNAGGTGYGTAAAVGITNPNNLPNGPSLADAMGIATHAGLVTFIHDNPTSTVFTCFFWSALVHKVNAAAGWIHLGNMSVIYTQQVDQFSLATFAVPEGLPIFLMATTNVITNCWMGGCAKHSLQPLPDRTPLV